MYLGLGHNYILLPPPSPSLLTPFLTGSEKGVDTLQHLPESFCPPYISKRGVGDLHGKETVLGHMISYLTQK